MNNSYRSLYFVCLVSAGIIGIVTPTRLLALSTEEQARQIEERCREMELVDPNHPTNDTFEAISLAYEEACREEEGPPPGEM